MGFPVVLHANLYQFSPGQRLENPCVGSRMLLWGRQGSGEVVVDGQRRPLPADAWLLLPWRHRVIYFADSRRPFLIGGIHLCPDHAHNALVELRVPHTSSEPLHDSLHRHDVRWPGLDGLVGGSLDEHPGLRRLSEWIVGRWVSGPVETDHARSMAQLLADELMRAVAVNATAVLPAALATTLTTVCRDLARPLDLAALARLAGCSPPTLVRLFRNHLRSSPMAWLRSERIEVARRLLAGSALPIAEVGLQVGIADPHRFAKLFRAATGFSPRAWRNRQRL